MSGATGRDWERQICMACLVMIVEMRSDLGVESRNKRGIFEWEVANWVGCHWCINYFNMLDSFGDIAGGILMIMLF